MEKVKTLIIKFNNTIERYEIPLFRGAVIASLDEDNVLFHNHVGDNFRYSYPLIQYKRINKKAAIVCIDKGTEAIGDFFSSSNFKFSLGDKEMEMLIENINFYQIDIASEENSINYRISNWLPLNSKNYELYNNVCGLVEKVQILERILNGNILSMLKGLGIHLDYMLNTSITNVLDTRIIKFKSVKLMSFDVDFSINIQLPNFIGIGKNNSIGYGVITRVNNK